MQVHVHASVREIRGQEVETRVIGRRHEIGELRPAAHEILRSAFDERLAPHHVGRGGLRIEIPEKRRPTVGRGTVREVDGRRRLPHSAFDVVNGNDFHGLATETSDAREFVILSLR